MPFPAPSEAFQDQVAPRAKEGTGHAERLEAVKERLVVRDYDRAELLAEFEQGVVRAPVSLHGAVLRREPLARPRIPVVGREQAELLEDGSRHGDVHITEEATELRLQIDPELEGHEERVGIEEHGSGHRNRTTVADS